MKKLTFLFAVLLSANAYCFRFNPNIRIDQSRSIAYVEVVNESMDSYVCNFYITGIMRSQIDPTVEGFGSAVAEDFYVRPHRAMDVGFVFSTFIEELRDRFNDNSIVLVGLDRKTLKVECH